MDFFNPMRRWKLKDISMKHIFGVHGDSNKPAPPTEILGSKPYENLKTSIGQMAAGQQAQAGTGLRARLVGQGLYDVPGVASSAAGRLKSDLTGRLATTYAGIDQQQRQEAIQQSQYQERMKLAWAQFNQAKTESERAFWSDLISNIVGGVATMGASALMPNPPAGG